MVAFFLSEVLIKSTESKTLAFWPASWRHVHLSPTGHSSSSIPLSTHLDRFLWFARYQHVEQIYPIAVNYLRSAEGRDFAPEENRKRHAW